MLILYSSFMLIGLAVIGFGTVRVSLGVGQCLGFTSDMSSYIFFFSLLSISVSVLV